MFSESLIKSFDSVCLPLPCLGHRSSQQYLTIRFTLTTGGTGEHRIVLHRTAPHHLRPTGSKGCTRAHLLQLSQKGLSQNGYGDSHRHINSLQRKHTHTHTLTITCIHAYTHKSAGKHQYATLEPKWFESRWIRRHTGKHCPHVSAPHRIIYGPAYCSEVVIVSNGLIKCVSWLHKL